MLDILKKRNDHLVGVSIGATLGILFTYAGFEVILIGFMLLEGLVEIYKQYKINASK